MVEALCKEYREAFQAGDGATVQRLLTKLKLQMSEMGGFLEPAAVPKEIFLLSREVLELATLQSAKDGDLVSFERHVAQVKPYFWDVGPHDVEASENQAPILGLNLLRLLTLNRIAEFHVELELIPSKQYQDPHIRFPILLEQYSMEGSYSKLLRARKEYPHPSFQTFLELLVDTVRTEVAACCESSYLSIAVPDAMTVLNVEDAEEMAAFAEEREWKKTTVDGRDVFVFDRDEVATTEIPAHDLIRNALTYAKELERIV